MKAGGGGGGMGGWAGGEAGLPAAGVSPAGPVTPGWEMEQKPPEGKPGLIFFQLEVGGKVSDPCFGLIRAQQVRPAG